MQKMPGLVCAFSLFFCQLQARQPVPQDTAKTTAAQIVFVNDDTVYDFGGIPKGAFVEYQFEIKNTGGSPLVITGMKCESANVKCKWPGKPVKPGRKNFITITYTANTDEGSFSNDIFITSNATESPYPFIRISGAITPEGSSMIPSGTPASKSRGRHAR
jgi:uncharacterized protein DUF1573